MHEAMLYEKLSDGRVRCGLCAHRCLIREGETGICQVRENEGGTLYSLVYGRLIAQAVDPIEKKPLFHFMPGSVSFSVATVGCNFQCTFCQNSDISQRPRDQGHIEGRSVAPEAIVSAASRYACKSIAYTYTEPTVFFEYTYQTAQLAHEAGLANVYVTNGYMTKEMLDIMAPSGEHRLLDAANVDLKAFTDAFYRQQCGARLQPVLDSLKMMKERGIWLEVTTLIIPGYNDSDDELRDIARFICHDLGADTPWHVSRFHPTYRLTDAPPTPAETLLNARRIGQSEGLHYVYVGNIPTAEAEHTYCPKCSATVIRRRGFQIVENRAEGGRCAACGAPIAGVGL